MELKSTEIFVKFGGKTVAIDKIDSYHLKSKIETLSEKSKRRKSEVESSTLGGGAVGGFASAVPAAIAIVFNPPLGLGILATGLATGGIVGNRKSKKKFDNDPKNRTLDHSELIVTLKDGEVLTFCADNCNFNIYDKHKELNEKSQLLKQILEENAAIKKRQEEIASKIANGNDPGEEKVDYAVKWCLAQVDQPVVAIAKDCESKYRYGCIYLGKSDFIDEPQEYDHILVSGAGIILIETKHWRGRIEIRPDGKWLRDADNDGHVHGIENPAFQMQRHEMLIKSIFPDVPVFSLLCFSNTSAVLDGQENFKDYPIVYVDQLKDALSKILISGTASDTTVDYIVEEIEKHKINKIHSAQE